jgi:hypothetical protein
MCDIGSGGSDSGVNEGGQKVSRQFQVFTTSVQ